MHRNLLTVVAEMVAQPGKEDELRQALLGLVEPTRQEEGFVQYDLHQATGEPGRFLFYENWTSAAALEHHLQSPHLVAFLDVSGGLLAEPPRILTYARIA
ncbi:MAG: antibiotic biosynthesis monooxygenase [Acidobacteria bacterium]|nr:antibiotic biosynthesis monooxygenase [Acidobacteriota bacterium]